MSAPERSSLLLRRLPSPLGLALLVLGGILVLVALAHGLADADYFWHFATGRLIADSGQVPSSDPFSFTWAGRPWTPHEWLGELLIYWLVSGLGGTLTAIVFGLLSAGAVALGALTAARLTAARLGARSLPIVVAAAISALVLVGYVTVRPQVISWLLFGVLSLLLLSLDGARPRRALLLIPLFVVWANLHGLYVVGLGAVAVYALFTLAGRSPMAAARGWMAVGAVGALLGSMATPAGPAGILYPLRYLRPGDWGLSHIAEWQSPNFHDPANIGLLLLVVGMAALGTRRVPGWMALLSWIGLAMSLVSLRNAPIAAVWALPVVAASLQARLPVADPRPPPASRQLARRLMETTMAVVVLASAGVIIGPQIVSPAQALERAGLPVAGVDELARTMPNAHVFAEYGWAGYVINRLHDRGARVFVDGRNDMYPQAILEDYSSIREAHSGWQAKLDRYGTDAILLPPDAPLAGVASSSAWCEKLRDDHQVLLERCAQP